MAECFERWTGSVVVILIHPRMLSPVKSLFEDFKKSTPSPTFVVEPFLGCSHPSTFPASVRISQVLPRSDSPRRFGVPSHGSPWGIPGLPAPTEGFLGSQLDIVTWESRFLRTLPFLKWRKSWRFFDVFFLTNLWGILKAHLFLLKIPEAKKWAALMDLWSSAPFEQWWILPNTTSRKGVELMKIVNPAYTPQNSHRYSKSSLGTVSPFKYVYCQGVVGCTPTNVPLWEIPKWIYIVGIYGL